MKYPTARLTLGVLAQHLEQLLLIDRDTDGESWQAEHFLLDLPGKWECSRLALTGGGRPAGFAIASIREDAVHVHRLAVGAPFRGRGLGTELLRAVAAEARTFQVRRVTLKVARTNKGAIDFYRSLGFIIQKSDPVNLSLTLPLESLRTQNLPDTASEKHTTQ